MTRSRTPSVKAFAVVAAVALGVGGCADPTSPDASASMTRAPSTALTDASATKPPVVGYAEAGSTTTAQIAASRGVLTTVGVDGVNVTSSGAGVTPVSTDARRLLTTAHA